MKKYRVTIEVIVDTFAENENEAYDTIIDIMEEFTEYKTYEITDIEEVSHGKKETE